MAKTEVKSKGAKDAVEGVVAYNTKLKASEVIKKCIISHEGNRYYGKGVGSDGTKMCVIMSKDKAEAALKAKWGTKGQWD